MKCGHHLIIGFEKPPSATAEIEKALARQYETTYKKVVLIFNRIGLLPKLRFVKRPARSLTDKQS